MNEDSYHVTDKSMIINLAERSQSVIYVHNLPVLPLKAAVVKNVHLENISLALVVKNYLSTDLNDISVIQKIKHTWPSLYEASGLIRHKGLPYYKSPKFRYGEGKDHLELNFCFVSEPFSPSGPHKDHDRDFDEVHALIRGVGKMRMFTENDYNTLYRELNMSEGTVHDKIYDSNGNYTWHEFQSVTPCVYCPIELDRK